VFLVERRVRIVPVAIRVANPTVWPMDHQFRLLVPRNVASAIDGLTLRRVNARQSVATLAPNTPVVAHRNYMLSFRHNLPPRHTSAFVRRKAEKGLKMERFEQDAHER
jgi:hypothetical protein